MSEKIAITVVKTDGDSKPQEIHVTHDSDMTLMSTLQKEGLISDAFCGGRGVCGRCRVQFLQTAPIPTAVERNAFLPDELRRGYRLACMAKPKNHCVVRLDFPESYQLDVVTKAADVSEKNDQKSQGNFIVAVDLGTTTIAMQLRDLDTGECMDTYCALNPQRAYGADVLSRIRAAGMGHAEAMRDSVRQVLQEGLRQFCKKLGANEENRLCCMSIAGNITMGHLLMGFSTDGLGKSPFTPVQIGLQRDVYTLPVPDALPLPVYVLPGISAFVGGDIVAGLCHCGLLHAAAFMKENISRDGKRAAADETVLFIDLGTNGELAIVDKERMIVTATAAGPAFEGGAGVPGSDMVALAAYLLDEGIMDETGLLREPYFSEGITLRATDNGKTSEDACRADAEAASGKSFQEVSKAAAEDTCIRLTQKDIRELQMAKAAVRAGVEILYEKMGAPSGITVYLAGGFGYYLDVEAAVRIGLIPEHMGKHVKAVGNTALAGAFDMGRWIWNNSREEEALKETLKETLEKELGRIMCINLAKQDGFEEKYVGNLNFPVYP